MERPTGKRAKKNKESGEETGPVKARTTIVVREESKGTQTAKKSKGKKKGGQNGNNIAIVSVHVDGTGERVMLVRGSWLRPGFEWWALDTTEPMCVLERAQTTNVLGDSGVGSSDAAALSELHQLPAGRGTDDGQVLGRTSLPLAGAAHTAGAGAHEPTMADQLRLLSVTDGTGGRAKQTNAVPKVRMRIYREETYV